MKAKKRDPRSYENGTTSKISSKMEKVASVLLFG
jgi:hypothetical protein